MTWHPRWHVDLYLMGFLSSPLEAKVRAHLAGCESCRSYYDQGVLVLRASRGNAEGEGLGEWERIERRGAAVARWERVRPGSYVRWFAIAATAAALLVLVASWWPQRVGVIFDAGEQLTIDGKPASIGDEVAAGAVVEARKGDSAVLLDGNRGVLLREGSRARFGAKGAEAKLEQGRARFAVKPGVGHFAVIAGETRVEVHGTIFVVERRSGEETVVAVHRGEVLVSANEGKVTLQDGQESVVTRGIPSAARRASADSLQEDRGDFLVWLKRTWLRFLGNLDRVVNE